MRATLRYLLVGSGKPAAYLKLAKKLGIAAQVSIVGGRDDVPQLLAAADLMLHPAYRESAGYTLLEAVVAGLPVLATETCGYAYHLQQANAGVVCPEPFSQSTLNKLLSKHTRQSAHSRLVGKRVSLRRRRQPLHHAASCGRFYSAI